MDNNLSKLEILFLNLKKNRFRIPITIFIILFTFVVIMTYKDGIQQTYDLIYDRQKNIMSALSTGNYEYFNIYKPNGEALSDDEIANYFINSGLYRSNFVIGEIEYWYDIMVNPFNIDRAYSTIYFTAANGEVVTAGITYDQNIGLITKDFNTPTKEMAAYKIPTNLKNGEQIKFIEDDEISEDAKQTFKIMKYVQTDDELSLKVIKEGREDLIIYLNDVLEKFANRGPITIGVLNGEIKIEGMSEADKTNIDIRKSKINVSNDGMTASIFYNEYYKNTQKELLESVLKYKFDNPKFVAEVISGNTEWNVKVNHHDYNTEELIKSENLK